MVRSYDHLYITLPLMVLSVIVFCAALWRDRHYTPGKPSLVPLVYVKITALIIFVVLMSNLLFTLTGVSWQSPFSNR